MNLYPYTDFHELNDDWIIGQTKKNEKDIAALQNTIINLHFDFDSKADKATTYTKTQVDTLLLAKADTSSLATVATSGNYNDLSNKPTIPAAQVNSDWNAVSGVAQILNKPTLSTVATSGNYNDLNNKPTIPAAQVNSDWNAISGVAEILNKPNTISGYGITDAYDKTYIDANINAHDANFLQFFKDNTNVSDATMTAKQSGDTRVIQLYVDLISPSTNEVKIGNFTGLDFPASGYWCGAVTTPSNTQLIGGWILAGANLYIHLNTTAYTRVILTLVIIY